MKKILYTLLCAVAALMINACGQSYLETSSPSVVDANFVFSNTETARAAMYGVYESWRAACQGNAFGDGLYYALDVAGSDIERHPEAWTNQPGRHYPEGLYLNGTYAGTYGLLSYQTETGSAFTQLFACIGKANAVITAMENADSYEEFMSKGEPSALGQMYGEAMCARVASYRELIKYYGDVPYTTVAGQAANGLAPRDSIYDCLIADLEKVIPVMYRVGSGEASAKNIFSRTFAEGMLGRICLDAAGYQTRRGDFLSSGFYKDGKGNALSFEKIGNANNNAGGAEYGRRSDWKTYAEKAKTYFKAVIDNPGSAKFYTTDPRANGTKIFDNPYQYFFQQMNDLEYADESIYEYAQTQGTGNDARPYSYGRPSDGGGSNAFPCKNYGQGRENPAFYWGMFDPNDMRRDVSITVTGSDGKGAEKLIPFTPNSKSTGGGLSLNKWDENRMAHPYCLKQRTSGINGPYMRMAEMYLGYAEACALTGDDANAKTYLAKVRERSFPSGKAGTDAFISSCGSLYKAVIQERGFEYAAEGDRRWTLIRSGLFPEAIKNIKEMTAAMIDGLEANGYYTFDNGNQISAYVWTKLVDAKTLVGHRLTTQTPDGLVDGTDEYGVLYPGWRGQNDDWAAAGKDAGVSDANITKNLTAGDKTNLAIQGLFRYIDPDGAEAKALETAGYTKVEYGKVLVEKRVEYLDYVFPQYDYVSAPIYLMPYTPNAMTTGGFTNGYGFRQE